MDESTSALACGLRAWSSEPLGEVDPDALLGSVQFDAAGAQDLPTLFLLPGSLGHGPSMAAFARALGATARVVPIRYPLLEEILCGENTLAQMVNSVLEQVSRSQPAGPIRLLGHSLGGALAYEVAARLLVEGRSVEFVGILDTSIVREPSNHWRTIQRTFHRIGTNRVTAARMVCRALAKMTVAAGFQNRLAKLIASRAGGRSSPNWFRLKLELQEVLRSRAFLAWQSEPKQMLPLTAILFRCNRQKMPETLGWNQAFVQVKIVPVAGSHYDLVFEPHLTANRPLIERAVIQTYSPIELNAVRTNGT